MFIVKFCPKFNYVKPNKNLRWSEIFFKDKKNHKLLKFIHNNCIFSHVRSVTLCRAALDLKTSQASHVKVTKLKK